MSKTLQEYYAMPTLEYKDRAKKHVRIVNMLLDNPDLLRDDLQEIVDYFVTELGNADFIRLFDDISEKVKRG